MWKIKEYIFSLKENTLLLRRDIIQNVSVAQLISAARRKEVRQDKTKQNKHMAVLFFKK